MYSVMVVNCEYSIRQEPHKGKMNELCKAMEITPVELSEYESRMPAVKQRGGEGSGAAKRARILS